MTVYLIEADSPPLFPHATEADSNGLLCIGGDLSIPRLLAAYKSGIFPWYEEGFPIMWHALNPRAVLFPDKIHISQSMQKFLRKGRYSVTQNRDFESVITACQIVPRAGQDGTWITNDMQNAYIAMHKAGHAISFEAWEDGAIVGGLYGVIIGGVFFGESMFSLHKNGSKVALIAAVSQLKTHGVELLDIQMTTTHMQSMGAEEIPIVPFLDMVERLTKRKTNPELLDDRVISLR
ncbi:leucyl/phenylalanyl-tRNA--protein transferase [bacterium]|nr:leucyl/phenylalanyl-tRNA--protein transferase [bacterium]